MLSPEVFVFLGSVMVVVSLVGLVAAHYARGWFFTAEPRTSVQLVDVRTRQQRQ